ncbi:ABC transporter permease [Paenibacillus sp. MBLB4367]|uniref:ABC transporter permease n=1 Tax=Paenibacillus sp. MBLB4367 TaxID=3384767 RepID=UPI00390819FF
MKDSIFSVLASKSYAQNLQYRGTHAINTVASAIFGFIYVSVWVGIGSDHQLGGYGEQGMIHYVAFNQVCLWLTVFMTNGLGIIPSVRTGQISLDLMRPVHLFYIAMSREWGQIAYRLLYKSAPIYILYAFMFALPVPTDPMVWLLTFAGLALAAYIAICIQYLIGISALWTTESNWLVWVNTALAMLFSGYLIPIEWLPVWLQRISAASFYPYLQYHPTRMYLGYEQGGALFGALLWCVFLTLCCLLATRIVRGKLEVQGG